MEGGYKKVVQLDDTLAAAASGPKQGDVEVFVDWLQRVLCLKRMTSGGLTVSAAASLARRQLAQDLRRRPMDVNMLLGGWDKVRGAQLYWLDGMGSLQPIPFGAHGAASSFVISVLDKGHRGDETELRDAVRLMRDCVAQLSTRYLVRGGGFQMMVVDARGCRDIGCGECVLGGEGAGAQDGAAEEQQQQQQRRHLSGVDR
ncbi:nucleophile aminohydrolase [Tribonema minus]|uniref:Nucleophile aminohydrolase n=1 Tax=Tribonema minus TaxID=303371 RepID=A0A835ZGL4_9STRA|nr:nucleophile aminohydrolase [Tribonema minus]